MHISIGHINSESRVRWFILLPIFQSAERIRVRKWIYIFKRFVFRLIVAWIIMAFEEPIDMGHINTPVNCLIMVFWSTILMTNLYSNYKYFCRIYCIIVSIKGRHWVYKQNSCWVDVLIIVCECFLNDNLYYILCLITPSLLYISGKYCGFAKPWHAGWIWSHKTSNLLWARFLAKTFIDIIRKVKLKVAVCRLIVWYSFYTTVNCHIISLNTTCD